MKVLLISINAKYIHTNNAVRLLKVNSSFDTEIMEYTIKDDIKNIAEEINNKNPDVVACSMYIWNVNNFKELFKELELKNAKLVLGGPEVSYDPTYFLTNTKADFVIKGEGEIAFEELLKAITSNKDYKNISSLSYKDNGNIINNPIKEITDLSVIKLPYYIKEDIEHIPNKISYIESSRGCPYKCSYCLSSLEKTVRFFNTDEVKKAILYLMEKGSKTIKFLDRTFNANKNTLDLLDYIIENNNHKTVFQFEITGDVLDPKIIEHLNKKAPKGLFRFEIGIQSINEQTNLLVDRFQNTEKLFNNIKLIQKGNIIDLHLDLIAGLPLEDLKSFINTFDNVFNLKTKELQLGFLKMLRGTKIRFESDKYGYEFNKNAPYEIISNNALTNNEIKEIHLVEHMLELYHNKGYFRQNMLDIIISKESPYQFFLDIGNHFIINNYKMKGYQIEDIYKYVFDLLNGEEIYLLKQDYLVRSKIKPKIFFENIISKEERNLILTKLSQQQNIPLNKLYKHSVLIKKDFEYFVALYQNHISQTYKVYINKTP
ncbi:coproporphyrinogen III oxidase [Candidatus Izimaplasma bacterium HR1]|jgi:radical SAM superfamily enzyme YgiQ (UPF0313 family)|uniref:B12-binding domain-containing radical SAM protein n=1 Tax=Candidatus Izimoplasma sp. HR1 TaxID=1541959 RepID=UPI0004F7B134|nr:coproporphyrinogen III oxidase [Candidatus Izimaplasma bacterium HR1]